MDTSNLLLKCQFSKTEKNSKSDKILIFPSSKLLAHALSKAVLLCFLTFPRGDNVDLSVINPRREKSGTYKVVLKNAQGQDERDIHVNIMGMALVFE